MPEPTPIPENELEESFSHASGPGGQHVNKVATRVTLRHRPTGLSVTVQEARSQSANRRLARERLAEALHEREQTRRLAQRQAREKQRRKNRPRPRGVKEEILKTKRHRSEVKKRRGRVRPDTD